MKLGMTAVMPASAFTDEHECMKITKQLLGAIRRQLADQKAIKGQIRISILIQALADAEPDKVGEAVRASLHG